MVDRREFLGAMLAAFCGIALPAPVARQSIRIGDTLWTWDEETGPIWARALVKDAYYATFEMYSEGYLVMPNGKGLVTRVKIA